MVEALHREDKKLPTIEQLKLINESIAHKMLTEIHNGILSKVKEEQISKKKKAKNELKDILGELHKLNKELLQTQEQTDIDKLEETKELYNSKYHGFFQKEAEKIKKSSDILM